MALDSRVRGNDGARATSQDLKTVQAGFWKGTCGLHQIGPPAAAARPAIAITRYRRRF
jgi:hypothetical protein